MKTAVVTGASTGIGRATAIELGKTNLVFLVGRSQQKLEQTKALVELTGGKAEIVICDLSDLQSITSLLSTIKEKSSQIDMIVNVAGIWHGENEVYAGKDFDTFSTNLIQDTFTVGLLAPMLLVHGLIPVMPRNGKIVNISGTFENGAKGWLPYFVSKKALEDLTIGLAEELKEKDIQVNAVSPSDTATDAYKKYFPQYITESIEPEVIAKQVAYLCSEESNSITGKVFVMKKDNEPYEGYHS